MKNSLSFVIACFVASATLAQPVQENSGPVFAQVGNGSGAQAQQPQIGNLDLTGGVRRPQNDNEQFVSAASTEFPDTALATPLSDLNRTLVQGTVMQATLETAIQSDLPGMIRAIVSFDIRSYDGSQVLVPKGSRLFGTYRADLALYQKRALILWTRVITPDGLSIMIGSRGTDRLGRAGQTGFVDTKFDERFGSAALISFLGAAPTAVAASQSDGGNEAQTQILADVSSDFQSVSSGALEEYLTIPPTIYIDQGSVINVLTERDVIFPFN